MVYVVPQVQVFQEFDIVPTSLLQPLPAHLSGGHAKLIRYAEPTEKPEGSLGQYNPNSEASYLWPGRPAGARVDRNYTKLFVDDALLRYYDSSSPGTGDTISTVSGHRNRLEAAATNFASNGSLFPHSAVFKDRGVRVGDVVRVRATVDSVPHELCTYVAGFIPDLLAAVTGSAVGDASNAGPSSDAASITLVGDPINCVEADLAIGSSYDGLADGVTEEVYTVRVLQSSVGGDPTTAVLRVTSESGTDDVPEFSPAAYGAPTAIGSRGVQIVFDLSSDSVSCEELADTNSVSPDDLIAGQEWEITVSQEYEDPDLTLSGDYTGQGDDTYIIEIVRGTGPGGTPVPQFSVRTTRGLDVSGPTNIATAAVNYPVGTKGLFVAFSSTDIAFGAKWYVDVTAAKPGDIKTLVLGHNLPEEVVDEGVMPVTVELYIRKNLEVPANRQGQAPLINWEQSDTEITVYPGVTAYDASYTEGGVPLPLPLHTRCGYSKLYLEVRYWLAELAAKVTEIGSVAELSAAISGPIHPDNPLKYAAFKALQNSNGTIVNVTAVCDPDDVSEWEASLTVLDGRSSVYGLVPLSKNALVWSLFATHVENQSTPENGRWRVLWLNPSSMVEKAIVSEVTSTDSEVVMAAVEDDPNTSGTQFTLLRVPGQNGQFVTNGVRPGDIVRYQFNTDGFGGSTYDEFVVDAVINEDTLRLQSGLSEAVSVPERMEIWRTLPVDDQAAELALTSGFASRRVRFVWPDTIEADGFTVPGYHLCAALAGLTSGVVPHQGLTNLAVAGFSSVPRTTELFGRAQLNVMAEGGVWIVTQDPQTGEIYTRDAVTTGDIDNLNERQEMIVRNLDSISYFLLARLAPYIGISNVTDSLFELLRAELNGAIKFLGSSNFVPRLGSQLISGVVRELRAHALQRDRVVTVLDLELPAPLNYIDAHLVLVA